MADARGPLLDSGCFVAGLEYAAQTQATVLGKPSAAYFDAALRALDAEPGMTWMVGDDLETDIVGARGVGMRTVLVRTGKFRPDAVERVARAARRDRLLDRAPARLARGSRRCVISVGTDLIEIERIRRVARAVRALPRALLHRGRARVLRLPAEPGGELRGRFAGKEAVGKALGFGVARAFAWQEIEIVGRPKPAVRLSGRLAERAAAIGAAAVDLSMTHSRELAQAVAVASDRRLEPLYTAEEMRAAEAGHDVDAMMQRAGAAVAEEVMRRFPDARRIAIHAGGGANGGDGQIAGELLVAAGREIVDERPDVIIDALLGTGMKGAPRDDTARVIEQINAPAFRWSRSTSRRA